MSDVYQAGLEDAADRREWSSLEWIQYGMDVDDYLGRLESEDEQDIGGEG
jgi:hypothetical protein